MPRGLFVGRFQPFHLGHLEVVRAALAERPASELILGIGSAQASYTLENPMTSGERIEMIGLALDEARLGRAWVLPIPDLHRHAEWAPYVESLVPRFDRVYTNNPLTRLLFERAGYAVAPTLLVQRGLWEGRAIRERLAEGLPISDRVSPAVAAYLDRIGLSARLRALGSAETGAPPSRL